MPALRKAMMKKPFGNGKPKFKVPSKRVPSDDCTVTVNGETIKIHEGEWVDVLQVGTLRQYTALLRLQNLVVDETDTQVLSDLCEEVAGRVVDWNWTGLDGKKLSDPYKNTRVIEELSSEEVAWLIKSVQGETLSERKNGLPLSGVKS
jgi:hypothetical protein|tara:strand:- start:7953 stop:8396 length:444 start_codon:yes stop_codon:yes gene_type:complete